VVALRTDWLSSRDGNRRASFTLHEMI